MLAHPHLLLTILALALFATACGGDEGSVAQAPAPTATVPPTAQPTARPTAAPLTATPRPTASPTPRPTATPAASATPYGGGGPASLDIPAIGVKDARIVEVGLEPNGAMETPQGWWDIGWYKLGPPPGQPGNSVLSGHYDSDVAPAVFWNLSRLKPGDLITVGLQDGTRKDFIVETAEVYPFNKAPLDRIFGPDAKSRLNLITCNGSFDPKNANYDRRLVVYAVAVEG